MCLGDAATGSRVQSQGDVRPAQATFLFAHSASCTPEGFGSCTVESFGSLKFEGFGSCTPTVFGKFTPEASHRKCLGDDRPPHAQKVKLKSHKSHTSAIVSHSSRPRFWRVPQCHFAPVAFFSRRASASSRGSMLFLLLILIPPPCPCHHQRVLYDASSSSDPQRVLFPIPASLRGRMRWSQHISRAGSGSASQRRLRYRASRLSQRRVASARARPTRRGGRLCLSSATGASDQLGQVQNTSTRTRSSMTTRLGLNKYVKSRCASQVGSSSHVQISISDLIEVKVKVLLLLVLTNII